MGRCAGADQAPRLPAERRPDIPLGITAVVAEDRCLGCGICVELCPEDAIELDAVAVIDPLKCTACGSCRDECPCEAISLVQLRRPVA
jgi:Pyruvate/2-oxoacid:ferredoxin oxidoreductase delta subunit